MSLIHSCTHPLQIRTVNEAALIGHYILIVVWVFSGIDTHLFITIIVQIPVILHSQDIYHIVLLIILLLARHSIHKKLFLLNEELPWHQDRSILSITHWKVSWLIVWDLIKIELWAILVQVVFPLVIHLGVVVVFLADWWSLGHACSIAHLVAFKWILSAIRHVMIVNSLV